MGRKLVLTGTKLTDLSAPKLASSWFMDTFTRADSTNLGTTEEGGKPWVVSPAGGNAVLASGRVGYENSGSARFAAYVDAGKADGVFSFDIPVIGPGGSGFTYFRYASYSSTLYLAPTSSTNGVWALYSRTDTSTLIAQSSAPFVAGDHVDVTLSGENVTVKVNGVTAITATTPGYTTGTHYGFGGFASGIGTRWDNMRLTP